MKKLKLIYNPNSGNKSFKNELHTCVDIFQRADFEVHIFCSHQIGGIDNHIRNMSHDFYDTIVVSGGDGTINLVLNALLSYSHNIPIGIIPSGTANDFARFLNIPKDVKAACDIIASGNKVYSDVGQVNDKYFINVCGAGLFTNVSQQVDNDMKNILGKMAYYLKGLEQLPNFVPFSVKIKNSKETIIDDIYLFLVLNSAGTGGFEKLSTSAEINDGKFDFIAFKQMPVIDLAKVFLKVIKGDYLDLEHIIYFQDNYMEIENLSGNEFFSKTDTDGETGPILPIKIKNIPNAVQFYA